MKIRVRDGGSIGGIPKLRLVLESLGTVKVMANFVIWFTVSP